MYCVYFHRKPDTLEIFYVGMGSLARPSCKRNRSKFWRNVVTAHGDPLIEIVKSDLSWEEASELEKFYIAKFGRIDNETGILVNLTDGGDGTAGMKQTEAHRKALSIAQSGRKQTPEHIENGRKAKLGRKIKPCSEERRRKMSEAMKGRVKTPEHLAKIAEKLRKHKTDI